MRIPFRVGDKDIEFRRSWWTGSATLVYGVGATMLQDPLALGTHFSLSTTRTWTYRIDAHEIVIEKVRPRFFAGFRPQAFRVLVDGELVAERRGY